MNPTSKSEVALKRGCTIRQWGWGILVCVTLLLAAMDVSAQEGRVTGRATDASSGAPLSEVQVYIVGMQVGTLSRQDGRYLLLNVPAGTHEVTAERIGMGAVSQQVTVTAGGTVEVDFILESQALGLDEIVVTGAAGAARRREIGNSIAQINVSEIPDAPVSASAMLLSSAPGVELTSAGGEIGQGSRIQLRGQSSLSMTNQPIIYVDGVRMMSGGLPQTATPEYRTGRGANITASPLDQINPNDIERIEIIKGSAATTLYGTEASAGVIQIFTKRGTTGAPIWNLETQQGTAWARKFGVEPVPYNWMEPYMRADPFGFGAGDRGTLHNQMYSASVQGGGGDLQYFLSGQMDDQMGLMPLDELRKYAVRANFSFAPVQGLQVQWNSGYSDTWMQNTPSGNNAQGLTLNVFRQERNYFGTGDPEVISQVFDWDIQQNVERFTTGGTITYSPIPDLSNRLTVGYDFTQQEARNLRPYGYFGFPQGGLMTNNYQNRLLTFDYVGNYRFDISSSVRSNFAWGGQAVGEEKTTIEAWGEGFPGASEPTVNSAAQTLGFEEREKVWNAGFFLQNVFDIQDKYFVTLGARVDGNSAFGEGFGLQFYPKAAATWVVSDENFWPAGWGDFRFRTAYGQSGRAPGAFDAVRTWSPESWEGRPAFIPQNVGNPDLGPEVSEEIEVGFEAAWFGGRVRPEVTYFWQTTKDALLEMPQIASLGFTSSQLMNIGELKSGGLEVALQTTPVEGQDWGWDLGVNLSLNHNEIVDLGGHPGNPTLREGLPLRPEVDWFVTNPDEIGAPEFEAEHYYGPSHPTRMISVNTSVRAPLGIMLSATGEYRGGHYIDHTPFSISYSARSPLCFPYYVNPESSIEMRDDAPALWRARCQPQFGRSNIWKADYFKLRSVSAQVPVNFAFPDQVSNAVLTLALNNSFLWMKEMPFMDPEMLGNQGVNSEGSGMTERIPTPISLRMSLRITF